jgi:HEAT repeat protein
LFPGPHGGQLVTSLIGRCADQDASVRVRAIQALTILDVKKEEIPGIVKAMDNRMRLSQESQVVVRFQAAVCLMRFGEDSRDALTGLLSGAEDPQSFEVRRMSLRALQNCGHLPNGTADPRVTRVLLKCLSDPTAGVRLEAVIALGSVGRCPDPMLQLRVDQMIPQMINDRDKVVGIWALVTWMSIDKPDEPRVARLKGNLSSTDQRIRINTIRALGIIGARVRSVLPALIELLHDKDPVIVTLACTTLAGLGKDAMPAVKALTDLSERKDVEKVIAAIAAASVKQITGLK